MILKLAYKRARKKLADYDALLEYYGGNESVTDCDTDFYLVPACTFRGAIAGHYSDGSVDAERETALAVINAVDGSIINTQLGY